MTHTSSVTRSLHLVGLLIVPTVCALTASVGLDIMELATANLLFFAIVVVPGLAVYFDVLRRLRRPASTAER